MAIKVGDFVETIYGINGILTEIRKGGYYGDVAFIATSDMRTFYCPVSDLKKEKNNYTHEYCPNCGAKMGGKDGEHENEGKQV